MDDANGGDLGAIADPEMAVDARLAANCNDIAEAQRMAREWMAKH